MRGVSVNWWLIGIVCVLALGCSADDGAGDSGSIWTAESDAIEIDWFNFFEGGYRFARRRDQLSSKQLELAQAIQIVPSSKECWEDAAEMSIKVSAGDSTRKFSANEFTGNCGRDVKLVDFDAATAMLDTVHCLAAKSYNGSTRVTAPSIVPDDGCGHGLFNGSGTTPTWWLQIEIPAAGEYRISVDACGDRELHLDLFENDGTTPLASASGDGECPVLTHTFTDASSKLLRVEMLSGALAGDFHLSVDSSQ